MAIKVIVNGAKGRMGEMSSAAISADPELELVGQTDLGDNLNDTIKDTAAAVVVDFTVASASLKNAEAIVAAGARPVIGTSGFTEREVSKVSSLCAEAGIGGIIAPNFSLSAVLMMKFAADAAKYMPECEIIEYHHTAKEDSPSGTALKTAELIAASRVEARKPVKGKEIIPGSRGAELGGTNIHAVRIPGVIADQEVVFGGHAQSLTIKSACLNREAYMPGVCYACKKVIELDDLVFGLDKIL